MFCKKCNTLMKHVMRFEKGKALELERCPKCYAESKANPLKFHKTNSEKERTERNSPAKNRRKSNVLRLYNNNQRAAKTQ